MTFAFILSIIRRGEGFVTELDYTAASRELLKNIEGFLLIAISELYIWGFWAMKRNFEPFDVIEKKSSTKSKPSTKRKRDRISELIINRLSRKPSLRSGFSISSHLPIRLY